MSNGDYIPLEFRGRDRLERHEELIAYSIRGGISQARLAHATRQGEGRIHMNVLWEMGSLSASCRACSTEPRA